MKTKEEILALVAEIKKYRSLMRSQQFEHKRQKMKFKNKVEKLESEWRCLVVRRQELGINEALD